MLKVNRVAASLAVFGAMVSLSIYAKSTGTDADKKSVENNKLTVVFKNNEVSADPKVSPELVAKLKKIFLERDKSEIDSVRSTPIEGLYEVRMGQNIIYTDVTGNFMVLGELIDVAAKKNITQERITALQQIEFASLPKQLAVKYVRGKGEREIALFEDPFCGYCRKQQQELQKVDNVTVYVYIMPILSPESASKARNISCSANPGKTYVEWMVSKKEPPQAASTCKDGTQDVLALGRGLGVQGTPTIYLADGRRLGGYQTAVQLESQFTEIYKAKTK